MKITPAKKRIGSIKPGEPFELPEKVARHLIKHGIAKEFDEAAPARTRRAYKRRDMTAEA